MKLFNFIRKRTTYKNVGTQCCSRKERRELKNNMERCSLPNHLFSLIYMKKKNTYKKKTACIFINIYEEIRYKLHKISILHICLQYNELKRKYLNTNRLLVIKRYLFVLINLNLNNFCC